MLAWLSVGDVDLNYEFVAARLPLVEPSGVNTESTTSSTFTGDSASGDNSLATLPMATRIKNKICLGKQADLCALLMHAF